MEAVAMVKEAASALEDVLLDLEIEVSVKA